MSTKKTYLLFDMYVFERKDELGQFNNSTNVQLIAENRVDAEKRALEIAGDDRKTFVHTKTVIERFVIDDNT